MAGFEYFSEALYVGLTASVRMRVCTPYPNSPLHLPVPAAAAASGEDLNSSDYVSDDDAASDDGKTASLCVLLHGGLKVGASRRGKGAESPNEEQWYSSLGLSFGSIEPNLLL